MMRSTHGTCAAIVAIGLVAFPGTALGQSAIETDGYERIVVTLAGQMLLVDETGGTVGVVLIPDIPPFDGAFTSMGLLPAPLEIGLTVNSRNACFLAPQQKFDIGFPHHRALAFTTAAAR